MSDVEFPVVDLAFVLKDCGGDLVKAQRRIDMALRSAAAWQRKRDAKLGELLAKHWGNTEGPSYSASADAVVSAIRAQSCDESSDPEAK